MNSVLGAYKRNVVGTGFQLRSMTKKNAVNKELERLWKIWCKARNCDVTGQQSLNQILRMAVVRKKVDGGILFVKRYTRDGILPFSLQMLEADELDSIWNTHSSSQHPQRITRSSFTSSLHREMQSKSKTESQVFSSERNKNRRTVGTPKVMPCLVNEPEDRSGLFSGPVFF